MGTSVCIGIDNILNQHSYYMLIVELHSIVIVQRSQKLHCGA